MPEYLAVWLMPSLKKTLVFCYDTDINCYTEICKSSVQWRDVTVT